MIVAISTYRLSLGLWLGGHCRFFPSCSTYGQEAVHRHGALRGLILILRRLSRCHPWGPSGHDPVPHHVSGSFRA